jgi:hypothetical protein
MRGPHHLATRATLGHAWGWCGHLGHYLEPFFRIYKVPDLKIEGGFDIFPDRDLLRRHHQESQFGTRNSVLAPYREGKLEEIIAIIITDASPSTIHDSPIHM